MSHLVHFIELGDFEIPKNDIALPQLWNRAKNAWRLEIWGRMASIGEWDLTKGNNQIILPSLPISLAFKDILTKWLIIVPLLCKGIPAQNMTQKTYLANTQNYKPIPLKTGRIWSLFLV